MEAVTDSNLKSSYLSGIPPLQSSINDLVELAGPKIRCNVYQRGERVYTETDECDHIFALRHGRVRTLRITPQGKDVTLYLVEPGQLFGVDSIARGDGRHPWGHDAEVIDHETVVVSLPRAEFGVVAQRRPDLMSHVMRSLWSQSQDLMDQAETRAFHDVRGRLAYALLMLAYKEGIPTTRGVLISPVMTHEELAALAGTRRESVTTTIGAWKRAGILADDDMERALLITNVERLAEFREGGTSAGLLVETLVQRVREIHGMERESRMIVASDYRERRANLAGLHPVLDLFPPGYVGNGPRSGRKRL